MSRSIVAEFGAALLLLLSFGCQSAETPGEAVPAPFEQEAKRVGAAPILKSEAFPAEQRAAVRLCAQELKADKEEPGEFYATVEEKKDPKLFVVHLWHQSAFSEGNRGRRGNPGGKCRNFHVALEKNRVVKKLFWE